MPPPNLRHRMSNIERQMDTYGSGSAGNTPIQSGGAYGEFGSPPQQERLYTERNPFTTPYQGFSDPGQQGSGPHVGGQMGVPATMQHENQHYKPWADRMGIGGPAGGPMPGIMGLPGGAASDTYNALTGGMYDQPGDYDSAGLWQTWKRILERTGNEDLANQWLAGQQMAYRPGTYGSDYGDDDYGPFIPPSVYEMDDDWLYDPDKDEYEFDYIHGNLVNTGLA